MWRGSVTAHELGAIAKRHFTIPVLNRCGADVVDDDGYGGIAHHLVPDTYVALFSRFIPCGVWKAVCQGQRAALRRLRHRHPPHPARPVRQTLRVAADRF